MVRLQMADLKVTIKGAAKVDQEVKERRDGSLLVKYISHMSGDVSISIMYGRTTIQGSPFKVRCQPPKADTENSTITLMQEHAFIDDTVKACVRTVDQFGEKCSADGMLTAQVLDAASEQVLFDAHIVETGHVRTLRS
jgi:Filamin/ABP280 repeat